MPAMHRLNNLQPSDLSLLPILEALIAERHISRAAIRLNRSQPAVSHALARLRDLFNDPLLVRGEGGLQPTARALQLVEPQPNAGDQQTSTATDGGAQRQSESPPTRTRA